MPISTTHHHHLWFRINSSGARDIYPVHKISGLSQWANERISFGRSYDEWGSSGLRVPRTRPEVRMSPLRLYKSPRYGTDTSPPDVGRRAFPHHHQLQSFGEAARLRSFSRGQFVLAVGCLNQWSDPKCPFDIIIPSPKCWVEIWVEVQFLKCFVGN